MMDVLTSETCWALNNEIIKQVTSSWSLFIQLWSPQFKELKHNNMLSGHSGRGQFSHHRSVKSNAGMKAGWGNVERNRRNICYCATHPSWILQKGNLSVSRQKQWKYTFCSDCHVIVTVRGGKIWREKCKDRSMTRSMNLGVKVAKIRFVKQLYKWILQQMKSKRKRKRRRLKMWR